MPAVAPPGPESNKMRPNAEKNGKKGSCYRCMKGNRFTQKETCIVCSAKYCCNCVLRAIGSMPEGRKCVACIGFRIDEAKRENLGKCSKMLKRMLTEMEIKQIMRSEMSCRVNQLPPELVFVNADPLSQKQLDILRGCPHPPKKLTSGSCWYDSVSGLWGKVAGEQCEGNPHFWMIADGSYQEEGQNHIKGRIWDKKRVKLVCALLSSPTPPNSVTPYGH